MTDTSKKLEHYDSLGNRAVFIVIIAAAMALGMPAWIPFPGGILVAYLLVTIVAYGIPPRPQLGFGSFTLKLVSTIGLVLLAFWALPKLLTKWIWRPLAFGLPILALAIVSYWLPTVFPAKRMGIKFSVWLLASIALVVFFVWFLKP